MFGSSVVEVGLGLALLFFLLATITSAVNELIVGLLQTRASFLREGVTDLLGDAALAEQLLRSPLIRALWPSATRLPSYIPGNLFATALMDLVGAMPRAAGAQVPAIRQRPLAVLAATTDGTSAAVRDAIANWYDAAMDRISGAYKRRVQWNLLAIAVVLTAVIGVDSVAVADALWRDQTLRATAAAAAGAASSTASLQQAIDTLSGLHLPLGWGQLPSGWQQWAFKVIGLAVTAVATSLGAPFWYDTLRFLTNVRSSGPAPASSSSGGGAAG